ncbi:hypothetical protein N665_0358s0005 [Sinapis alba]|nr:hypothetical protein N665_0358s0005 [Sinapis alba]
MSRCFPFPPPGYEKKIRTDEADSLIKENQKKEKKHKKEKKDKEKKEGKDTSKDKHKERKEKKEKHKDRKDKDRSKEKGRTSEDKKASGVLPNTGDGEKPVTNTLRNNGNGESKFIQDLARRNRDEEEATESQSVGKIGFPGGVVMEKRSGNAGVSSYTDQKGTEFTVKPMDKKDEANKMGIQEKNHRMESVTMADMSVDREGIKKSEPKNTTYRSSKEEKTESIIGKDKPKYVEGGARLKERVVDTSNFRMQDRASVKNLTSEGILGKQKNLDTNGFLYENGSRPKKIQRPVDSPVSSVENGIKLGACQTPLKPVSELQETVRKGEAKEHRVNGFIKSQEPKSRPTISSVEVNENGEASAKKRPHSDLKYLEQILNVPKREELHEVDETEEEWLFGHSGMKLLKKPKTDSTTSLDESLQVWNQALSIESADILALPYVIPF